MRDLVNVNRLFKRVDRLDAGTEKMRDQRKDRKNVTETKTERQEE